MRIGIIRIELSMTMFAMLSVILQHISMRSVRHTHNQEPRIVRIIDSHGAHLTSTVTIFGREPSLVGWVTKQEDDDIVYHGIGCR